MLSMTLHKSLQMRSPLGVEKTHFDFRPPLSTRGMEAMTFRACELR